VRRSGAVAREHYRILGTEKDAGASNDHADQRDWTIEKPSCRAAVAIRSSYVTGALAGAQLHPAIVALC
jgi:hypothetical protein